MTAIGSSDVESQAKTAAASPASMARLAMPSFNPPPRMPRSNPVTVATLTRVSPAESGFISTHPRRRGWFPDKVRFLPAEEFAEGPGVQIELGSVLIRANG